jgi:hypothetical protein
MTIYKYEGDFELLPEVAKLHKLAFDKSLMTTMKTSNLINFYNILLQNKSIILIYKLNNLRELDGALFLRPREAKKIGLRMLMSLCLLLLQGLVSHPIIFMKNLLQNLGLYSNLQYENEISTIFIRKKSRSQNIGSDLINFTRVNNYKNIIVNTNIAQDFYLKNNFKLLKVRRGVSVFLG